ncbi:hypothetical protein BpHYR1_033968 [Brachionus plicatilis]|uniref:Uncharacterized protein n=1 Tax=Brachionus plicatilis TaxID=10195 RepID=A0A3M7SGH5_BRAPC|nr:hypothetical protein BpHYR1_033968 [Brachionus plicatilis]
MYTELLSNDFISIDSWIKNSVLLGPKNHGTQYFSAILKWRCGVCNRSTMFKDTKTIYFVFLFQIQDLKLIAFATYERDFSVLGYANTYLVCRCCLALNLSPSSLFKFIRIIFCCSNFLKGIAKLRNRFARDKALEDSHLYEFGKIDESKQDECEFKKLGYTKLMGIIWLQAIVSQTYNKVIK